MKEIDFYQLPRSIQDNLLDGFRGEFDPRPILSQRGERPTMYAWLGLSGVALLVLIILALVGFGEIESMLAMHPVPVAVVYVALAGTIAVGVAQALAYRSAVQALPFRTGVYLFPACLVDAREQRLRVFPLSELTDAQASSGSVVTARFGAQSYAFRVPAEHVEHAVRLVLAARERVGGELEPAERRKLDPLEPPVVPNPLASTVPLPNSVPSWLKLRWVAAGSAGLVVGGLLFFVRNATSDARMFETVAARDDIAWYKVYLERGSAHRDEVARVLLPRAELRVAVAEGSVEAIDAFEAAYPETGIADEVAGARAAALLAAFERARKAGTLADLEAFASSYPNHGLGEKLNEARHAIYARALEKFKAAMPAGADKTGAFAERLVAFAEKKGAVKTDAGLRGPVVAIRVTREPSKELKRSDDLVQKNPMYTGVKSLPSRYLDDAHLAPHEGAVAKALAEAFGKAFDPEILVFTASEVGADAPLPKPEGGTAAEGSLPALVLSYRVEPSGSAYASKKPMGIYVGLLFYFTLEFGVPGEEEPLKTKQNFVQRIPLEILRSQDKPVPAGTLEKQIYDAMAGEAFAEIQQRYLSMWFASVEPPKRKK